MSLTPFTIQVPQATLDDLRERLRRTRWPDTVEDAAWDYGTNLEYLKSLVDYWLHHFDWRTQEAQLNAFAQFRAEIDGFGIHFLYERGKGPHPLPLVLTHGWPDSFYRMYKLIPLLTDPARFGGDPTDAFDVIVPSLPGYGFSDRPQQRGMTPRRTAQLWVQLLTQELGYPRFAAAGGDIGGGVTRLLALCAPERLVGIHLTDVGFPAVLPAPSELSDAEQQYLKTVQQWREQEGAYAMQHATKPQTLAYGLNDSPVGLAGWIVEKFRAWSDCQGEVEQRFSKDELLTNIMIYWVTETINSSIRMYYEIGHSSPPMQPGQSIEVPAGVALFPKDIGVPPRAWAERTLRVQRWTPMPRGGHFAALEEPALLADDLRAFFRPLRAS